MPPDEVLCFTAVLFMPSYHREKRAGAILFSDLRVLST